MSWQTLPENIHLALDAILMHLDSYLDEDASALKDDLTQLTQQYGQVIESFIRVNHWKKRQITPPSGDYVPLLKQLDLFNGLNEAELQKIADQMTELVVDAGTDLVAQNEPTEGVYFIRQGGVQVLVNEEQVNYLDAGQCFGEMSCLREETHASATVRAAVPSHVLRLDRENFIQVVNSNPRLWQNVFRIITSRFTEASHRLSELLQHTPQGLLKVNANGLITNEFSTQCTRYLGRSELTGLVFSDLMFREAPIAQTDWNDVFPLFFEDIPMSFQQISDLLPKETVLETNLPEGTRRYYALSYYACENIERRIVALDVGIEDITMARTLSQKSEALEQEKAVLQRMYDNPDLFLNMLQLAETTIHRICNVAIQLDTEPYQHDAEILTDAMRILHSLKGSCSMFQLTLLKEVTHEMEDCLRKIQYEAMLTSELRDQFHEKRQQLETQYVYARSFLDNMSQELRRRLTGVIFSPEEFAQLKQVIYEGRVTDIQYVLHQAECIPAKKLFQNWSEEIQRLCERLGKEACLELHGKDALIPPHLFEQLEVPLLHLLRNCVDHGLETLVDRMEAGKPMTGRITVEIRQKAGKLYLSIEDDGKGLDISHVIDRAKKHPYLNQAHVQEAIDTQNPWKILFLPGFSTAANVTDISGRGVGLDAVQHVIASLHGSIEVASVPGSSMTFSITLPLPD